MSDHNPLIFHLLSPKPPPVKKIISFRKIKNIDIEKFTQDLAVNPLITSPSTTVDTVVTQYPDTLSSLLDVRAPVITKEVQIRPHTAWFNECIQAAKRERRKAERKWCKNKLLEHLEQLQEARKKVNSVVKQAKVDFYQGHITEHAKDQRALFKMANTLLHKKKSASLLTHDDPTDLANIFAQFFRDKIDKIRQLFPSIDYTPVSRASSNVQTLSEFKPVTTDELRKVITEGNSKSCSLDPIPIILLKACLDILLPVLTDIVNINRIKHIPIPF